MKRKTSILFLLLITCGCYSKAQSIHVLSVIETNDINRPDRMIDQERVQEISKNIAQYVGLDYYSYNFGAKDAFSISSVKSTIQNLKNISCERDVIWFHFSGFGRNDGQSQFPIMKLTDGELSTNEIIATLQAKRPKVLLVTIEAGNKVAEPKEITNQEGDEVDKVTANKLKTLKRAAIMPKESFAAMKTVPSPVIISNYERLFKDFEGVQIVVLSSCKVGQNSISNYSVGSEWLAQLDKKLGQITQNENTAASWESLTKKVYDHFKNKADAKQLPQMSIKKISLNCANHGEE
jgi:Caspase domain